MQHDEIAYLRANSAAWRLLRADHAALVLSFLGEVYVDSGSGPLSETALVALLDDALHALRGGGEEPPYPRSPRDYLDTWAAPEAGWLRKFYPPASDEPHYDATPALEKAHAWVAGLQARAFVGTESRLHTVVDLLRQMVHGAETDPDTRLAELLRRRAEIDAEIDEVEAGDVRPMDGAALRDRYQLFASTARDLLSDFREVEDNFRALDRAARERIAGWSGAKGELLEELLTDRTSIAGSDQGRSFQAFYDFLLSRRRQDELSELLGRVQELSAIGADRRLRHVDHDWLDAAERTQSTVRQLSEQLRRFLDDQVWLENRRVMDLLRSIESHALRVRDEPPGRGMEIDATSPEIRLSMERPLYALRAESSVDSTVVEDDQTVDPSALFDQVYVDQARLADAARSALRRHGQVALTDLLQQHPPTHGLAEIVGYLALAEEDLAVVIDESTTVRVPYVDSDGAGRTLRMPHVTIARRTPLTHRTSP